MFSKLVKFEVQQYLHNLLPVSYIRLVCYETYETRTSFLKKINSGLQRIHNSTYLFNQCYRIMPLENFNLRTVKHEMYV